MNNQDLTALLNELCSIANETEWIEFKTNNDEKLGEYISALSNSACLHDQPFGYLVFGIDDASHRIVGTNFTVDKKGKGNEDLIPWLTRSLNPKIHFDHYTIDHADGKVVLFRVCATLNTPVTFLNTAYIRIGSYKKKLMDFPEKERLIWKKELPIVFEIDSATEGLFSDEILKLLDYPSYFDMLSLPLPTDKDRIIEKLVQEKLIKPDNSKFRITNLGAILFAKELGNFPTLSRKAIRVIIYEGKNKLKTKKEQTGIKGYANGFNGLVDFIEGQLPSNEIIDTLRHEVKMYPKLAIRELVANAIIHQDFSISGTGPMIEIYSDRIEITNPGKPLIDTLRFVDHNPQSRNEKFAHFMRRLHICEERGSGIDKVLFECELYQLPAPNFVERENYTRVILYAHKKLRHMDKEDKIRATYMHSCLKIVSGEYMTNQTLRDRLGIEEKNYSMASRIIAESIKAGMVKDYDSGSNSKKHAKYVPFWY